MKIMIIASWYPSEESPMNGFFFQNRAKALVRNNCDVSVAAMDVRVRMGRKKCGITVTNNEGVKEYRYVKRNLTPFWEEGIARQQIAMLRKLYKRICEDSGKPDIIHLESARCAMAAVALARQENIPMTYTEHYSGILNSQPGSFLYKSMCLARDEAAHTFCISSAMKEKINPPEGKWSMLPNAVDFSAFSMTEPEAPFTFCALGSLRKIKGYDTLIRAFELVHREFPYCQLVIGGDGEEMGALLKLREQLSLADSVVLSGLVPAEQRHAFFRGKSAFVCSSHTETFSIVIVEALSCGIPIVATKCGGPEDLVRAHNGYLVEDSISSLADGMKKMVQNRNHFSPEEIRADAISRFDEMGIVQEQITRMKTVISA